MKVKLLTTISLFAYQIGISQTEKVLNGKVIYGNTLLENVEVINTTSRINSTTNAQGEFSIRVHANDSLLFFSKDFYLKKVKLTQENMDANNLVIAMLLKPEELDEVNVSAVRLKTVSLSKEEIKKIKIDATLPKKKIRVEGYKDVTVPGGVDFIWLGKQIKNLLGKEEEVKRQVVKMDFKKHITTTFSSDFFTKNLKLNSEEKELFLEFCDADPESKSLMDNNNILAITDFLHAKNREFKKLNEN